MLEAKNYFDRRWSAKGTGLVHQYEAVERQRKKLVIDHTTALTWQQPGEKKYRTFEEAEKYIQELKREENFPNPIIIFRWHFIAPIGNQPWLPFL